MTTGTDINSRVKEAEVYRSMGLPKESLVLYEGILSSIPSSNKAHQKIKERIDKLKVEIKEKYPEEFEGLTTDEVTGIQNLLTSVNDNAPAINDSAYAFKELGLYKEAIAEYEKLCSLDFPVETIIPDLCDCLFKLYPSMEIILQA
ncbi:MAG: hypothetical protein JXL81_02345, partial [Deltaproteobacteria bacterium]|nr:hypothetical protein [Deltaproteobacteria bacterium]